MKLELPKSSNVVSLPTNYYIVVDLSGSMNGTIDQLQESLLSIKDMLRSDDTLSLGWFSSFNDFDWICKGANLQKTDLNNLIKTKIRARGLTCYNQILSSIMSNVNDVTLLTGNKNSAFYWLSDGWCNDHSDDTKTYELCSSLKKYFSSSYIVGYAQYYNRNMLLTMAEKIGGVFHHISNYREMIPSYEKFVKGAILDKINIPIDQKYEFIWQVTDTGIVPLVQNKDNSVDVSDSKNNTNLYAINLNELDRLESDDLKESSFVFSLAYILSQKNKANLAVSILRKAQQGLDAAMLRKAFTVAQKGHAENVLKLKALNGGDVTMVENPKLIKVESLIADISENLGNVFIDLKSSVYSTITRKGNNVNKVKFETTDEFAEIIKIVGNENRPNLSFNTVRRGQIVEVLDADLAKRIDEFNKKTEAEKQIIFPIESDTFKTYTLIANGEFNFEQIIFVNLDGTKTVINPNDDLDIFDDNFKEVSVENFAAIYKQLIVEKAHASVLNFYLKEKYSQKHAIDQRVEQYGVEGANLVEEMGLDYAMRYSPKVEYVALDKENMDYVPFVEMTAQLKGSAIINAKKSYEKFLKAGKKNPGDEITFPYFEKYDKMCSVLENDIAVEMFRSYVRGVETTVDLLKNKIAAIKFQLITTNSWFIDIEKTDKFEYDGLVIETNEMKEYL